MLFEKNISNLWSNMFFEIYQTRSQKENIFHFQLEMLLLMESNTITPFQQMWQWK